MTDQFDCSMTQYLMDRTADQDRNRAICWHFFGARASFAKMLADVKKLAGYLQSIGVGQGDNVVLCLGNIPNAIVGFYAINLTGAAVNVVHPLIPRDALKDIALRLQPKAYLLFDEFYDRYGDWLEENGASVVICSARDYLPEIASLFYGMWTCKATRRARKSRSAVTFKQALRADKPFVEPTIRGEDIAVYMHSGGTTGKSKTVALSNAAFNRLADNILNFAIGGRADNRDAMLMVLPVFHIFGLGICMHTVLCTCGRIVLMPKFRAKSACRLVKRYRVDFLAGVPNMYRKMLDCGLFKGPYLKRIKACYVGGDKVGGELHERFAEAMKSAGSDLLLSEGYGLTEAGVTCINTMDGYRKGSLGRPVTGSRFAVINTDGRFVAPNVRGELAISGNMLMKGYHGEEENPFFIDEEGTKWFRTGDVGYMDEDGYVYFVDRCKRVVKISGVNVFPQEIENVTDALPEVVNSCAVKFERNGKPAIRLLVVLRPGVCLDGDTERKIRAAIAVRLMKYSQPAQIAAVEALPLTQIGKVDYKKVEEREAARK